LEKAEFALDERAERGEYPLDDLGGQGAVFHSSSVISDALVLSSSNIRSIWAASGSL